MKTAHLCKAAMVLRISLFSARSCLGCWHNLKAGVCSKGLRVYLANLHIS